MSLFDFFFPEQAQAMHLRELVKSKRQDRGPQNSMRQRMANMRLRNTEDKVETLTAELGEACLVIEALLEKLEEAGICEREDLARRAYEIDKRDGKLDGRLTKPEPEKIPPIPKNEWPGNE